METMQFPAFLKRYNELFNDVNDVYHTMARHFGLSDCAFWILYTVRLAERPLNQSELSGLLMLSRKTINSALKGLEEDGCIRLEYPPDNRRSKQLILTERGKALSAETVDRVVQVEERAFVRLSPQQRAGLLDLMTLHLHALREEAQRLRTGGQED